MSLPGAWSRTWRWHRRGSRSKRKGRWPKGIGTPSKRPCGRLVFDRIDQGTLQKIWNSHSRSHFLEADFRRPNFSPHKSTVMSNSDRADKSCLMNKNDQWSCAFIFVFSTEPHRKFEFPAFEVWQAWYLRTFQLASFYQQNRVKLWLWRPQERVKWRTKEKVRLDRRTWPCSSRFWSGTHSRNSR